MKKVMISMMTASILISGSSIAAASSTDVYKLSEATYPVVVNSKEYVDPSRPILSYKGSTYIPLARIADLTGVTYKWNGSLKQLEITSSQTTALLDQNYSYAAPHLGAMSFYTETQPIPPSSPPTTYNDWVSLEAAKQNALESVVDSIENPDYYKLTKVSYPVLVNGTAYSDTKSPILSYDGSTYIPLAKIGELTGVNYKWNSSSKQVEITTK